MPQELEPMLNGNESPDPATQGNSNQGQPPVVTPPVQSQQDPIQALLLQSMQDENRRLQEQIRQFQSQPAPVPQGPQKTPKEQIFEEPDKLIESILDRKLRELLGPTIKTTEQIERDRQIDHWMQQVKNTPQFGPHYANIENDLRQILQGASQLNAQVVLAAATAAVGSWAMRNNFQVNQPPANTPPVNNQPQNLPANPPVANPNLPAHLRPSGNSNGNQGGRKPQIQLTELELRLARENNLTPEQFAELRDLSAQDVINWKPQGAK